MSTITAQTDTLQRAVSAGTLGFGAAGLLAPNLLARTYGVRDPAPEFTFMTRLWGTSLLALGTVSLSTEPGPARRAFLTAAAAQNAVDALSALAAKDLPVRTRFLAAATSAGFGAANLALMGRAD
jgi:hypothetical protein